ncbi:MAG TPA: nitroreductase family protein [Clostridia bacterium]|nr:nitroreductase family protein [Clostridia bacterium]
MNIYELINARESCRSYSDKAVEPEKLNKLVEAARLAPSACNSQPWHFFVVTNPEKVKKISKCTQIEGSNFFTQNVPSFIVIVQEDREDGREYVELDTGIATTHICFAATEQGLSTCIIGKFSQQGLRDCLGLSKSKYVRIVVAVGYSDGKPLREKKRMPIEETMTVID